MVENTTYTVHLAEESPIETPSIDFFDSGIWVETEESRVFYPYRRIEKIVKSRHTQTAEADETEESDVVESHSSRSPSVQ